MHLITVPDDVTIHFNDQTGTRVEQKKSFYEILDTNWLNNQEYFGKDAKAVRMSARILKLFEGKKPGDVVEIEDAEFERLKESVEKSAYSPYIMRQMASYLDAITEAPEKPRETK